MLEVVGLSDVSQAACLVQCVLGPETLIVGQEGGGREVGGGSSRSNGAQCTTDNRAVLAC